MFLQIGQIKSVSVYYEDWSILGQLEPQYLTMEVWVDMCYGLWQMVTWLHRRHS